jgi:hypothetical protein
MYDTNVDLFSLVGRSSILEALRLPRKQRPRYFCMHGKFLQFRGSARVADAYQLYRHEQTNFTRKPAADGLQIHAMVEVNGFLVLFSRDVR